MSSANGVGLENRTFIGLAIAIDFCIVAIFSLRVYLTHRNYWNAREAIGIGCFFFSATMSVLDSIYYLYAAKRALDQEKVVLDPGSSNMRYFSNFTTQTEMKVR